MKLQGFTDTQIEIEFHSLFGRQKGENGVAKKIEASESPPERYPQKR